MLAKVTNAVVLFAFLAGCAHFVQTTVTTPAFAIPEPHQVVASDLPEYHYTEADAIKDALHMKEHLDLASQQILDNKQITCLSYNMYYEARNQPEAGIIAVGNVTLNRAKDGRFPKEICGVVYDRHYRAKNGKGGKVRYPCEFSWTCVNQKIPDTDQQYIRIRELATNLYYGNLTDNTHDALFYHANYVNPGWKKMYRQTVRIGAHIFYAAPRPKASS